MKTRSIGAVCNALARVVLSLAVVSALIGCDDDPVSARQITPGSYVATTFTVTSEGTTARAS